MGRTLPYSVNSQATRSVVSSPPGLPGAAHALFQVTQHVAGVLKELRSDCPASVSSAPRAPGRAVEERDAEFLLKLMDAPSEGRLGEV